VRHALRTPEAPRTTVEKRPARRATGGDGGLLLCSSCGAVIAHRNARIEVQGAHVHIKQNPHGIRFRLGCFLGAVGCVGWGPETPEWSWFPPHAWQIQLCAVCSLHMGWQFHHGDSRFHGLILDRLVEGEWEGPRPA
jgi:hypothetical protein